MKTLKGLGALVGLILVINVIIDQLDIQFDLTSDHKYSLDEQSIDRIAAIDEPVLINVFLHGDIPIQFKKYRDYIEQLLRNIRSVNGNVALQYVDPSAGSAQERQDLQQYFRSYGVSPISRRVSSKDELSQSLLYPYISVTTDRRTVFIDLLGDKKPNQSEQEAIYQSEIGLEQKIVKALRDITIGGNGLVGVLGDQNEILAAGFNETRGKLGNYFFIPMAQEVMIRNVDSLEALIVVQNTETANRALQLSVDQAIMRSKPVMWMIDKYDISIDSIGVNGQFPASPRQLPVEDQLFKYGVRMEPDLIQDLQCSSIPQVVGTEGGQPKQVAINYPHHPVLLPVQSDEIRLRQEGVASFFATTVSAIDGKPGLTATSLLNSSAQSRYTQDLSILSFDQLRIEPDLAQFSGPPRSVATMITGAQSSYFANRLTAEDRQYLNLHLTNFLDHGESSTQIVIGDVQFAIPGISPDGSLYPLGYNKWDHQNYTGTTAFLAACFELMMHGDDLLGTQKSLNSARIIDPQAYADHKIENLLLMIGIPIGVMTLLSILWNWYRKRRYA
jgi:gliding-associated putative ABC transporter substrate-binding component GldG